MTAFHNKSVLVLGGSRGIGAAIVRRFVADGASVVFSYSGSPEAAERLAAETGSTAVQADSVPAGALHPLALRFTAILLVINVPLSFMGGFVNWLVTLIAVGVLWWPIYSRITDDTP